MLPGQIMYESADVFCDLSKVFDFINHEVFLEKLWGNDIRGIILVGFSPIYEAKNNNS